MTVDGDNWQTGQTDSYSGATSISTSAQFDPDGNLVGQTQTINGQVHSFSDTLNPADQPQNVTNDGLATSVVGDGGGNMLSQTIQNGAGTLTYNFDQTGRQNEIGVMPMGSTTPLTTTLNFNNNEHIPRVLRHPRALAPTSPAGYRESPA